MRIVSWIELMMLPRDLRGNKLLGQVGFWMSLLVDLQYRPRMVFGLAGKAEA